MTLSSKTQALKPMYTRKILTVLFSLYSNYSFSYLSHIDDNVGLY